MKPIEPINFSKYKALEEHYEKKIKGLFIAGQMTFGITLFCIGLAMGAMILDAEDWIVDLFIIFELCFLGLQIIFSVLHSYYVNKKLENYLEAEKEVSAKLKEIEERANEVKKKHKK